MPTPADILYDGDFTLPFTDGSPFYEYPFRKNGDRVTAFFTQNNWQKASTFIPQELGIPHPTLPDFRLIAETPPDPFFADLLRFTRTWSRIPVEQVVYSSLTLTKPTPADFGSEVTLYEAGGTGLGVNYLYANHVWDIVNNRVYGPMATTTSADDGADTLLDWTGHGVTTGRFAVYSAANLAFYVFASGQYTVTGVNQIRLLGFNFGAGAVLAGRYLRDYTSGVTKVGTKLSTKFYLPGVTPTITTAADIPVPTLLMNDATFLAAALANLSGYVDFDGKDLVRWMDSAIYQRETAQINMATL